MALLGFFTRTGYGTHLLNTPPPATSSTTAPDPLVLTHFEHGYII